MNATNSTFTPTYEIPLGFLYTIKAINNKESFVNAIEVQTYINQCVLVGDTLPDISETIFQHSATGPVSLFNLVNQKPS